MKALVNYLYSLWERESPAFRQGQLQYKCEVCGKPMVVSTDLELKSPEGYHWGYICSYQCADIYLRFKERYEIQNK